MYTKQLKISIVVLILIIFFGIIFLAISSQVGDDFSFSKNCITNKTEKEVRGNSMEPLIKQGETLILLENYYKCNEVKRGEIIAYDYKGNDNALIKRVLVLGGDSLEFRNNHLIANNQILKNSEDKSYNFSESQKRIIGFYINDGKLVEDAYLIFGDDLEGSLDSRKFGAVSSNDFVGKFIL